jgi:hypothetical protein
MGMPSAQERKRLAGTGSSGMQFWHRTWTEATIPRMRFGHRAAMKVVPERASIGGR